MGLDKRREVFSGSNYVLCLKGHKERDKVPQSVGFHSLRLTVHISLLSCVFFVSCLFLERPSSLSKQQTVLPET